MMTNQPQDFKKKKAKTEVSSASDWKNKTGKAVPLQVPSGNTALVKAPGMQVFLQRGFIPNSLMPIVQEAINTGKPPKMDKLEINTETLEQMMKLMDDVCCFCVIEPEVSPVPLDDEGNPIPFHERDQDVLYVDEVDLDDKTFIFQFAVGGTRDVEQFRNELKSGVGDLQSRANVEMPAVSTTVDL